MDEENHMVLPQYEPPNVPDYIENDYRWYEELQARYLKHQQDAVSLPVVL